MREQTGLAAVKCYGVCSAHSPLVLHRPALTTLCLAELVGLLVCLFSSLKYNLICLCYNLLKLFYPPNVITSRLTYGIKPSMLLPRHVKQVHLLKLHKLTTARAHGQLWPAGVTLTSRGKGNAILLIQSPQCDLVCFEIPKIQITVVSNYYSLIPIVSQWTATDHCCTSDYRRFLMTSHSSLPKTITDHRCFQQLIPNYHCFPLNSFRVLLFLTTNPWLPLSPMLSDWSPLLYNGKSGTISGYHCLQWQITDKHYFPMANHQSLLFLNDQSLISITFQ